MKSPSLQRAGPCRRSRALGDEVSAARDVLASITGYGPLQPYFDDPTVEEIWINAPMRVFVARNGVAELTTVVLSDREVRELVERMLSTGSSRRPLLAFRRRIPARRLATARGHPRCDPGALGGEHPQVPARHPLARVAIELGSITRQAAEFLRMGVLAGANILVSGATHTGKTTMLNALMSGARVHDRVVTVEETFELDLDVRDLVSLQCRQPSLEGTGEITLRRLIKEALRMQPPTASSSARCAKPKASTCSSP